MYFTSQHRTSTSTDCGLWTQELSTNLCEVSQFPEKMNNKYNFLVVWLAVSIDCFQQGEWPNTVNLLRKDWFDSSTVDGHIACSPTSDNNVNCSTKKILFLKSGIMGWFKLGHIFCTDLICCQCSGWLVGLARRGTTLHPSNTSASKISIRRFVITEKARLA